ncbi:hypothetical protein [Deinococcus gobiensis]|uniref:Uncharacterized protein n=1 Tax=Deinococcus gobiensis (strain DSM 21396 / JCM 16679 / CGMCC 1.7299 / I-0) TaxID=745776 RepID=H8H1P0_DEIGI|nr:hypothetical protein [Deinococcus gobiensis]AFD27437.1 hypothetical protein DGo_PB0168 [Deinococcus gobiensis I-0]
MTPQHLTLTPVAPAGAELIFSLYGYTYRVVGRVNGEQVFWFDLSPTYAAPFDQVVHAAVRGEDASMTVPIWHAGVSSAGGVLTVHAQQTGQPTARADWTPGPEAAAELQAWIGR